VVIIINGVLPVFAVIALGKLLRCASLVDAQFLRIADRLVYFIFFPALLFIKISTPADGGQLSWRLIAAVLGTVFLAFTGSIAYAKLTGVDRYEVGSFSQLCFRFSTYVGMALVMTALGEKGAKLFALIIGPVIPFINVLSVGALIWFSGQSQPLPRMLLIFFKELILNPLIIACALGIAYSRTMPPLPRFLENTLGLMASLALPLSLVSVGASLTLRGLRGHLRLAFMGSLFKLLFLPAVGYCMLRCLDLEKTSFAVAMIYFALPTSPAIYILSSQLNSDVDLAAAGIALSVLLSMISLSATVMLFLGS
jgi:malonate transporter